MSTSVISSVSLLDLHPAPADLRRLVEVGLQRQPKQLPAWLLYDDEGSRLFDLICEQPEYSLTRIETALLAEQAHAIADLEARLADVGRLQKSTYRVNRLLASERDAAERALAEAKKRIEALEAGLRTMVGHYVELAGSGDCGFWDPEKEPEVIAARALLSPASEGKTDG
jgi:uncharacterized SAM-dependent methyltransferase